VSSVEPSGPYQISLAVSVLGVPFLAIALGGLFDAARGGDPVDAVGAAGAPAFAAMFLIVFTTRLIFWDRTPRRLKVAVRLLITGIAGASVVLAGLAGVVLLTRWDALSDRFFLAWFTLLALLCQIGSVTWVLRYRQEV
jgi:hypothetical protein